MLNRLCKSSRWFATTIKDLAVDSKQTTNRYIESRNVLEQFGFNEVVLKDNTECSVCIERRYLNSLFTLYCNGKNMAYENVQNNDFLPKRIFTEIIATEEKDKLTNGFVFKIVFNGDMAEIISVGHSSNIKKDKESLLKNGAAPIIRNTHTPMRYTSYFRQCMIGYAYLLGANCNNYLYFMDLVYCKILSSGSIWKNNVMSVLS